MYDIYFYACNIIHIYTYIYIYYFCFLCEINEYNICILMTYFREYTYDYFTTSGLHAEIWVTPTLAFSLVFAIEFRTCCKTYSFEYDYMSLLHITYETVLKNLAI